MTKTLIIDTGLGLAQTGGQMRQSIHSNYCKTPVAFTSMGDKRIVVLGRAGATMRYILGILIMLALLVTPLVYATNESSYRSGYVSDVKNTGNYTLGLWK